MSRGCATTGSFDRGCVLTHDPIKSERFLVAPAKAGSRAAARGLPRVPAFERVKELKICWIGAVGPSRQLRRSFLRMRSFPHAIKDFLILRACESFASMGFGPQHLVPQSSRRPLYVVKFLPKTKRFTGSEEAARRPSRRTHDRGCSLHFDFLTGSFAGTTILFGPIEH